ncbi:hypothetical protein C1H46_028110 [Malus baccata]|uniref:Uncharacterized protein n=1 Tax=Malus baccata TaxID=106549 RepID=A0A540LJ78_MALBA|nr:hypothetical protein C1H46_028110 [Malus baccata]
MASSSVQPASIAIYNSYIKPPMIIIHNKEECDLFFKSLFLQSRPSYMWDTYITNLQKQDKDWSKDVLVVDED